MNMFARFDENPAMTLRVIKETKRYGRTDGQRENSIPPTNKVPLQTKFGGCIKIIFLISHPKHVVGTQKNGLLSTENKCLK